MRTVRVDVTVVRADAVPREHVALVVGSRGAASRCWCQRYTLALG